MFATWVPLIAPPLSAPPQHPGAVSATRSLASNWHTCARSRDGHVWCWGANRGRELGVDGPDRTRPVAVPGVADVVGVAAGFQTSCAWTTAGAVWCWGGERALGPTRVPGLDGIVELAASDRRTCARRASGAVACFVEASWAGTAPVTAISFVHDAIELAVGDYHGCARVTDGRVACWQFPEAAGSVVPIDVPEATGTAGLAISSSYPEDLYVVAGKRLRRIELDPATHKIMDDLFRELPRRPSSAAAPAHVTRLAAGQAGMCALGDEVTCWDDHLVARQIPGSAGATDLAVGKAVACMRTAAGHPACWGEAESIGDGSVGRSDVPVNVLGVHDVVQLAASRRICAREASGRVVCWGEDFAWDKAPADPVAVVMAVPPARELVVGDDLACARDDRVNVWCWGLDPLAPDSHRVVAPERIEKLRGATSLVPARRTICGMVHGRSTCVGDLAEDLANLVPDRTSRAWWTGELVCTQSSGLSTRCGRPPWSSRRENGIAIGKMMAANPGSCILSHDSLPGRDLDVGHDVVALGSDGGRACVVRGSGTVACSRERDGPVMPIAGLRDIVGITRDASCVLRGNGHVACGDLAGAGGPAMADVPGIDDAVEIVGDVFTCARRRTGRVSCWGPNNFLGDGSRAEHDTPSVLDLEL